MKFSYAWNVYNIFMFQEYMLEKHSDSGEFDGAGRSDSCNEEGDDSDDEAASANGSRSSPGDDNGTSGSGIPGVGISPENFDPTVIFVPQIYFDKQIRRNMLYDMVESLQITLMAQQNIKMK